MILMVLVENEGLEAAPRSLIDILLTQLFVYVFVSSLSFMLSSHMKCAT